MASLFTYLNRFLPFATPGTPLIQDLIHLGVLCTLLYFAPQIQTTLQSRYAQHQNAEPGRAADDLPNHQLDQDRNHDRPNNNDDADGDEPNEEDDHDDPYAAPHANGHAPEIPVEQFAGEGQAGPARQPQAGQRNIGAKKAKALARRDQRRAYNEFQRSQGEAQRARDAQGAAEREAVLAAERERRKATEAALEAKKAKEREAKKEAERRQREEDLRRRELVVALVKEGLADSRMVDLWKVARQVGDDVDEEWVEKILKASGLIGHKDDELTLITTTGWVARVSKDNMLRVYRRAMEDGIEAEDGAISYDQLGDLLASAIESQHR